MTNRTEQKLRWAMVVSAVALFCALAMAQDRPVSQAFYFNLTTAVSGGTFTNADSAPTWTLIKNGSTVVTTGTFTVAGTGTLAADYYGSLTLNSGSWTVGDTYAIEATGTISSVPVKSIVYQGFVLPAWVTTGYPPVDVAKWSNTGSITTGGIVNTGSISTGSFAITNGFTSGTLSTGTATIGTLSITNGLSAASLNIVGNATFSQIVTGGAQFGTTSFGATSFGTTTFAAMALTNASTIGLNISSVGSVTSSTGALGSVTLNSTQGTVNISTLTVANAGIGTTTAAAGAAWINGTLSTLTTYTGNTPQTGDSYARIGATGSGLTSLAPSATALSTAQWTNARAAYLDKVNSLTFTIANKLDVNVLSWVGVDQPPPNLDGYPLVDTLLISDSAAQSIFATQTSVLTVDGSIGKQLVDNVDVAISSRLSTVGYTAPNNAGITAIKTNTDALGTAMELDGLVYRFTANALEQAPVTGMTTDQFTLLKKIAKRNGIEP